MPIQAGEPAPDFELVDEASQVHRLSSYRGRTVILYFYPKDDTPGCTKEACNFRDDYSVYADADVAILGISPDSPSSHLKFKLKYQLPFPLLADEDKSVCKLYGVWGDKKFMGRNYKGVLRTTFLIDSSGTVMQVYENVKPAEHSLELLTELKLKV